MGTGNISENLCQLEQKLLSAFEPDIVYFSRGFQATSADSVIFEVDPFRYSDSGRMPERLADFKITEIGTGKYRAEKIN